MNTRGLMELVVLNIGFDLGVLTPSIFAMLVIMAVVTTFMTGPSLNFINFLYRKQTTETTEEKINLNEIYNILISYGNPLKGKAMLKLAHALVKSNLATSKVTTIHISPSNELNKYNLVEYEKDSILPIKKAALKLAMEIDTVFKPALDIDKEIIETSTNSNYDLLLIGAGHSLFKGSLLGKILGVTTKLLNPKNVLDTLKERKLNFDNPIFDEHTNNILKNVTIPVGIFIDRKFENANKVLLPIYNLSDSFLMVYIQKFISNSSSKVTILDVNGLFIQYPELKQSFTLGNSTINIVNDYKKADEFYNSFDLTLLNIESWKELIKDEVPWVQYCQSILILKA